MISLTNITYAYMTPVAVQQSRSELGSVQLLWDATVEAKTKCYAFSLDVWTDWNPKLLPENDEWSTIVIYSRDDEEIGMTHEIVSPKSQLQFSQMMTGQYWLGNTQASETKSC